MPPALAIHGGAWNIPDGACAAHAEGIRAALASAWERLRAGRHVLDVVEHAVRMLEDDPTFNAGRGSHLNRAGELEMDASVMTGAHLEAGAVAAIGGVRHPVTVARLVLEQSPHVLLAGRGARAFARAQGAELCRTRDLLVGRELERYLRVHAGERHLVTHEFRRGRGPRPTDTVGAVALDTRGRTAAATSTGGTQHKEPGRVGDSAIIGAGTWADDRAGAASATGWGEGILRVALAKSAVDALDGGRRSPSAAARRALSALHRVHGHAGILLVDRTGRVTAAFTTPRMARGLATSRGGLRVAVD